MSFIEKIVLWFKSLFSSQPDVRPVVTGFIPGTPDPKDHVFVDASVPTAADPSFGTAFTGGVTDGNLGISSQPTVVDLTNRMTPVEDQLTINSCVGHTTTAAFEALTGASDRSRLFAYYNARVVANQQNSDAGCTIKNALRAISSQGLADENLWKYDISQVAVKPPVAAYTDGLAMKSKIASYATITSFASFKTALSQGLPVMFGFNVPASFRTSTISTGVQQLQQSGEAIIGGHCVLAVGFDDAKQMVKVRNSFGSSWGPNGGYFFMPYTWFTNIGQSFGNLIIDPWVMVPVR